MHLMSGQVIKASLKFRNYNGLKKIWVKKATKKVVFFI